MPRKYDEYIHKTEFDKKIIEMTKDEKAFLVDSFSRVYKDVNRYFGDKAPDGWNWPKEIKQKRQMSSTT